MLNANNRHNSSERVGQALNLEVCPTSEWLTASEAARYVKIKPRTLQLWARLGKVRGYALSGTKRHVWRFRRADLDAALMGSTVLDSISPSVLGKLWRQTTQFSGSDDWIFASPVQLGRLPWSYPRVLRAFGKAASDSGMAHVSTHTMRHSYRSWLDAVGAPIAVQQKLMRHSDIRTTMNIYGDVVTDEMEQAASKVAGLALSPGN